ncbi:MAG: hypothetical protein C5B51_01675 [Terriglobia bacterium]|nr:MAG: hypothetical protein C5B51_01675 [Terriglobia bacterium]
MSETQTQPEAVLTKNVGRSAAATKRKKPIVRELASGEKIRAELNIEKWPAIWTPAHSKTRRKGQVLSRTLERESLAADGTKNVSQVTINPIAQFGDLTTEDQRTLYTLIKHWEQRGKPSHETPFSIRHLARLLHKRGWGSNVIDAITSSLERLRGTVLVWTRSYKTKDERIEQLETVYINILSKLKIVRRKVDGHVTTEAGYFQFDDHILKNLLANYTKPFLFDVFIDIKGEIALKLYSYLDLIMHDKIRFERRTKELFEELGLTGSSYRNPSKRKQNLERALAELQGKLLTTGMLKSARLEKTKDDKDYKVVFEKSPRSEFGAEADDVPEKFATAAAVVVNDYSKAKDPALLQAEEVVAHFHKVVHAVDKHAAQSKELAQAISLITRYGLEQAKFVVEFAAGKAKETHFAMQHFGAVLAYASRAAAEFDRKQGKAEAVAASQAVRPVATTSPDLSRGRSRVAGLTEEQYRARFEQARAELLQELPFLAQRQRGSKLEQDMVRSRLIRQLDSECMDLVPIELIAAVESWVRPAAARPEPESSNLAA